MDDVASSLATAVTCLDDRSLVVALDSVLHQRLLSGAQVDGICASPRARRLLARCDPASESGLETIARLALRSRRLRVATQVDIAGVGRVDLVIGDRLVLELDGEGWHDRPGDFEADRQRDRALLALGYVVMRASYRQVMSEWPVIERQILEVVRRRDHRWPRRRNPTSRPPDGPIARESGR